MDFQDFTLRFTAAGNSGIRVSALAPPIGETESPVLLPFDRVDLIRVRARLEGAVRGARNLVAAGNGGVDPTGPSVRQVGSELFAALFPDPVRRLLDAFLGHLEARSGDRGGVDEGPAVRLKIYLSPGDPRLAWLAQVP